MFSSRLARNLGVAASVALLVVATAAMSQAASAPCPSCGHNLIANPGAEAGQGTSSDSIVKVPGWTQTGGFTAAAYSWSGGDLSRTSPGPKNRGKNYFYGGPDSARSTGSQVISLPAGGISSGRATYALSGWIGGYDGQGDYCYLTVTFENASGAPLATQKIGPITEAQRKHVSELLRRSKKGTVPAATRTVKVQLVMVRKAGSDNDGLADNLALVLKLK